MSSSFAMYADSVAVDDVGVLITYLQQGLYRVVYYPFKGGAQFNLVPLPHPLIQIQTSEFMDFDFSFWFQTSF